jgi:hypothetical protein
MKTNLVLGSELGRQLSVTRQAIYQARKAGRIPVAGRDSQGRPLFDLAEIRRFFSVDVGQFIRPAEMSGGRPRRQMVCPYEAAALEARQWMAGQAPEAIVARVAATRARLAELASDLRSRYTFPLMADDSDPAIREFSRLELVLSELWDFRTDRVPTLEDVEAERLLRNAC